MQSIRQRLLETLEFIDSVIEAAKLRLSEELQLHRRDVVSRLNRRVREKGIPITRDILRARRERKARSRYKTLKNIVAPPRKTLSTRLRSR